MRDIFCIPRTTSWRFPGPVFPKPIWVFPKIGVPQNGWLFIMEIPIKRDDLGVPLFSETSIWFSHGFSCHGTHTKNKSDGRWWCRASRMSSSWGFCDWTSGSPNKRNNSKWKHVYLIYDIFIGICIFWLSEHDFLLNVIVKYHLAFIPQQKNPDKKSVLRSKVSNSLQEFGGWKPNIGMEYIPSLDLYVGVTIEGNSIINVDPGLINPMVV